MRGRREPGRWLAGWLACGWIGVVLAGGLALGCGGGPSESDCEPFADRAVKLIAHETKRSRARLIEACTRSLSKDDIACAVEHDDCLIRMMTRLSRKHSVKPFAAEAEARRRQVELEAMRARAEAERRAAARAALEHQMDELQQRLEAGEVALRRAADEAERARLRAELDELIAEYEQTASRARALELSQRPQAEHPPARIDRCPPGDPLCQ